MTKQQLIDVLSPALIANGATAADAQSVLETYTVSQLEKLILKQTPAPTSEEIADAIRRAKKLLKASAERDRDWVDRHIKLENQYLEKQRAEKAAREPASRRVFQAVAIKYDISSCEANFRLLFDLDVLNSEFEAAQAVLANAVALAQPTKGESQRYSEQRISQHNDQLRKLNPVELRIAVQQEAADKRSRDQQDQADTHLETIQQQDQQRGFPTLPTDITSEQIRNMTSERLKYLIKRFGNAAVTARIQGKD